MGILGYKKEKFVRKRAIEDIKRIGNRSAVIEALILSLKYEVGKVRKNAAEILGEMKDIRAVEPLIQALEDKSGYVREEAAEALGKIREPAEKDSGTKINSFLREWRSV